MKARDHRAGGNVPIERLPTPAVATPGLAVQLLLLAALWIVTHPYRGIDHDARLYAAQALHALDPGPFDQDLYFKYGSQDGFSLFTLVYRPLVAALGVSTAAMVAAAAGQLLWFAALLVLTRTLFGAGREALVAMIGAAVLCAGYGGLSTFRYAEAFTTPRLFAEALVLLALAFALRGRLLWAVVGIGVAAALHPIMAGTGAAVVAVYGALRDRRIWILIGLAAAMVLALAFTRVSPFDRLLLRFDGDWFAIVKARCGFGFLTRWDLSDWTGLAGLAAMLALAWRVGATAERRLVLALALTTAGSLAVSFVGGELIRNIFVVNVQPWRVLWLTTLLANVLAAVAALRLPADWASRRLLLAALLLSAAANIFWDFPVHSALFVVAAETIFWEAKHGPITARPVRYALAAAAIIALSVAGYFLALQLRPSPEVLGWGLRVAVAGAAVAACLAGAPARPSLRVGLLTAGLLIGAVLLVDARTAWRRFVEDAPTPPSLTAFVGGERNLYWEEGLELLWLKLHRESYYSCPQGSGAMFYAGTAGEFQRRSAILSRLNTSDFDKSAGGICPQRADPGQSAPSRASFVQACRALPELDALVLVHPVAGVPARIWRAPVLRHDEHAIVPGVPADTYYKVRCADVR